MGTYFSKSTHTHKEKPKSPPTKRTIPHTEIKHVYFNVCDSLNIQEKTERLYTNLEKTICIFIDIHPGNSQVNEQLSVAKSTHLNMIPKMIFGEYVKSNHFTCRICTEKKYLDISLTLSIQRLGYDKYDTKVESHFLLFKHSSSDWKDISTRGVTVIYTV